MNLSLAANGGTVEISDVAFGREYNEALVHQVVVAYLAGARQGQFLNERLIAARSGSAGDRGSVPRPRRSSTARSDPTGPTRKVNGV